MRLALIGDIHAYSLKVSARRVFLSRRFMGHGNLLFNRQFKFNHAMLDIVLQKVRAMQPGKVLFSGDVSTTSLEDEFVVIERYLRPLSEEFPVVVVPGNHDRYTFRAKRVKRIETILQGLLPGEWPHFEPLSGNWHLLALDSAMPQIVMSRGALGPTQMQGIRMAVSKLTENDGLLVLCHYPVATPAGIPSAWSHNLAEDKPLRKLLSECPARVVFMHGHIHKPWHWGHDAAVAEVEHSTPVYDNGRKVAPFTCINAGSPCMTSAAFPLGQGFWEIVLPEAPRNSLQLIHHVPLPACHDTHMKLSRRERCRVAPEDLTWESRRVL